MVEDTPTPLRLNFDLESDGLLDVITKIHCLWAVDVDTGEQHGFTPDNIRDCTKLLDRATELSGHNIISFDLPALQQVLGWTPKDSVKIVDTLVLARVLWSADVLEAMDFSRIKKNPNYMPAAQAGNHGLKAWGYRLGSHKSEYTGGWEAWSLEMHDYCLQDVLVCVQLQKLIESKELPPLCQWLETEFAKIISQQVRSGVRFDVDAAAKLYAEICQERDTVKSRLVNLVPPTITAMKTPQYWEGVIGGVTEQYPTKTAANKARASDIKPGPPATKSTPFSPTSRVQVGSYLLSLGWNPPRRTQSGQPVVDESTFADLTTTVPAAADLARLFLINKRLGQLADGSKGWLKLVRAGRIHGGVNTNGAVTGRCTHSNPNLAQVPSAALGKDGKLLWGPEGDWNTDCRALFTADPGWVMVGSDASGLELRALAHYLAVFDKGAYAKVVCEGDVHTTNQAAFGLAPGKAGRSKSKTGIYCKVYGGGPEKLGSSLGPLEDAHETAAQRLVVPLGTLKAMRSSGALTPARLVNAKRGIYASRQIMKNIDGFAKLDSGVKETAKTRKYLIGLDGRKLPVRAQHAALNTLLQSAGALLVKLATVYMVQSLREQGLTVGRNWKLLLHIHDETQATSTQADARLIGEAFVAGLKKAAETFKFRCPLTGEYKIGPTWAHTH